jgi:hypothetical protein
VPELRASGRTAIVGRALGFGLAVSMPAAIVAQVLDALLDPAPSGLSYPLSLVVLAGPCVAGVVVGLHAPARRSRLAGAVGVATLAVVLGLGIARRAAGGDDVAWGTVPFVLLLGGLLAAVAARCTPSRPGRTRP